MSRPLTVLLRRAQGDGGGGGQRQHQGACAPHGRQASVERWPPAWRKESEHTVNLMVEIFAQFAPIRLNLLFLLYPNWVLLEGGGDSEMDLSLKWFCFLFMKRMFSSAASSLPCLAVTKSLGAERGMRCAVNIRRA